jgi:flagellar assembly protein FliH
MHLSKSLITKKAAAERVLDYVPPKFEIRTPDHAHAYLETRERTKDFRMSDVIRIQTGVRDIEDGTFEERVEQTTLERLKEVQETAYKEAYQLGLEEGKHDAFKAVSNEINVKLEDFDKLIQSCTELKTELFQFNETHIVKLAMHMASRLAGVEIQADPSTLTNVMKSALAIAQSEENVVVQVSPLQFEFCETLKKETGRKFEFLEKVKFEAVEGISVGGCVIETNYGEIDARFEERVSRLWETMSENIHRVKDKISAS